MTDDTQGETADDARNRASNTDSGAFGARDVRIELPGAVRRDRRFVTRVTGLEPGERATLTVETDDGEPWSSTATFEADADGVVDLGERAPVDGDYATVDPMGPVWSMTAADGATTPRYEMAPLGTHDLTVTVETGAGAASDTVTVRHSAPGVERRDPGSGGPSGVWFEPPGDGPFPPVVVLHGSGGEPMVAEAALLASEGYAAFALQYLGTGELPDRPTGVPLEYVEDAVDWFLARDGVAAGGYGVYGVSMGAQLALLVASRDDRVDAAAVDAGNPFLFSTGESAAWTRDGESLPCIGVRDEPPDTWDDHVDGGAVRVEMWTQMLEAASTGTRRAATVPVEESEASLLLLSGSDDLQWPAAMFGNAVLARLDALAYNRPYEHRVYHDAGHGFGAPHRPTTWRPADGDGLASGGDPAAHASARADAWRRLLDLFGGALDG